MTSFLKQSHMFDTLETLAREDPEEAQGGGCLLSLLPTEAVCSVLTRRLCLSLPIGSQHHVDKALNLIGKKFKELNLTNIYAPPLPSLALPSLPMTSWVSMFYRISVLDPKPIPVERLLACGLGGLRGVCAPCSLVSTQFCWCVPRRQDRVLARSWGLLTPSWEGQAFRTLSFF